MNSETAKKMAARLKEINPNHYSELANMAKKPRGGKNTPGSFTSERASAAGKKGGKLSKRGPGKQVKPEDYSKPVREYKVDEL